MGGGKKSHLEHIFDEEITATSLLNQFRVYVFGKFIWDIKTISLKRNIYLHLYIYLKYMSILSTYLPSPKKKPTLPST